MSHIASSETITVVQRLMKLTDIDGKLVIHARWRGLPKSKNTLEPLRQIYDDLPALFRNLLARKNTPGNLAHCARDELGISA